MNKIYLISGASSDVGIEFIRQACHEDDTVVALCGHNSQKLKEAELHCDLKIFEADLTQQGSLSPVLEQLDALGIVPTHIIHLPAMRVINTKFKNFDFDRFTQDMNVQINSALVLCSHFLPKMAKQKYGRVLFMQSSYVLGAPPKNTAAYVMAKSALGGLCKSLAVEYAASGITVNCVAPSMMETAFLSDTPGLIVEAAAEANPMKRNAKVSDVVPAMRFLVSDEASFITGVTLPITGGSTIS